MNMINEKDSIRTILEGRGVIVDGVFDAVRFRKLVTEPWIYTKAIKYGFDKMNEKAQVVENEQVTEEVVEIQEPITVVEEVVEPQEVVETSTESIVDETPAEQQAIEEVVETVAEEPTVEVVEVVETAKKKTTKKK